MLTRHLDLRIDKVIPIPPTPKRNVFVGGGGMGFKHHSLSYKQNHCILVPQKSYCSPCAL